MSERRTKPRTTAGGAQGTPEHPNGGPVALGRKQQTVELARAGKTPSAIADQLGVPFATVMSHLFGLVGEGALKRSDIVFAFDQDTRDAIELAIEEQGTADSRKLRKALTRQDVQIRREDLAVYLTLRDARVALGDMYEMVRDAELALHDRIREAFVQEFGEEHWWREGIPANVRAECAALYEHDPDPAPDAFSYTTLIHLREILDKRSDVRAGLAQTAPVRSQEAAVGTRDAEPHSQRRHAPRAARGVHRPRVSLPQGFPARAPRRWRARGLDRAGLQHDRAAEGHRPTALRPLGVTAPAHQPLEGVVAVADEEHPRSGVFRGDEAGAAGAARLFTCERDMADGYRRGRHAVQSIALVIP